MIDKNKKAFIDIHTHLLPVQDGPKNMAQAIQAIQIAINSKISTMIMTPHFFSDDSEYDKKLIVNTFNVLKEKIEEQNMTIEIFLGNEINIDNKTIELIEAGKVLTLANTKHVLAEYPFYNIPVNYEYIISEMVNKGYLPIIAHPERNILTNKIYHKVLALKEIQAIIQINAASILGEYGSMEKNNARQLLTYGLVDIVASDAHSKFRRSANVMDKAFKKVCKITNEEYALKLFHENPLSIIKSAF